MTSTIPSQFKLTRANFSRCGSLVSTPLTKGVSVILFYMPNCRFCESFAPEFLRLPSKGIPIGAVDMSAQTNNALISMASQFPFQINGYPTILIYKEGSPCTWYIGARDIESIQQAVSNQSCTLKSTC